MLKYLVFLGATVQLLGALAYVRDTLKGDSKPNRMTWLMWAAAPMIGTAAALASGVRWSVLPVFMAGFGPLLVFMASFVNSKSYWKLEKFDYLCGLCSLLALIFWGITREPLIAIIFAVASDGFAAVPTLIKSWKYPETETGKIYIAGLFSVITSFFAIKIWNASALTFPIYLICINSALIFAVFRKKFIFKKHTAGF